MKHQFIEIEILQVWNPDMTGISPTFAFTNRRLRVSTLCMLISSALSFSVAAEDVKITKIEKDGTIDHRIDNCPYQAGFALFSDPYSVSPPTMSDFCFDEESGKLWSAEIIEGLELSIDGDSERLYEDIDSGNDRYDRNSVTIYSISDADGSCTDFMPSPSYVEILKQKPQSMKGTSYVFANGYNYDQVSVLPTEAEYDTLRIVMSSVREVNSMPPSESLNTNFRGTAFGGELAFEDGSAEIGIEGSKLGHEGKNHRGSLKINASSDGQLTGYGHVSWENTRVRGHAESEWVSAQGEFVGLRGHVVGDAAQNLKMRGWLRGEFTDINAVVRTFVAAVVFEACDTSNKK